MAAIEQGLHEYDRDRIHHFVLTKAAAEDVFRTVATEALADRIHNPGLERERADVIVGGAVILVCVMRVFGFEECLVSEVRHPRRPRHVTPLIASWMFGGQKTLHQTSQE